VTVEVTFGRYVLEGRIAVGGMGEVFLARQTGPSGFGRRCVVKRMHPHLEADPETSSMFLEEAQLSASITHPYVAQVYDFGRIDTSFYLAMEYVPGPPLTAIIKSFRDGGRFLPLDFICRVVSQAAQALDHVHRLPGPDGKPLNLVHRDISPHNILVSKDGVTKVIDFGIAKGATSVQRTQAGMVRGKVGYLSPERLTGKAYDLRSDIYALGLVMYELVTGRRAVIGRNDIEMTQCAVAHNWPAADRLRPDCPPDVLAVLAKASALDPAARYSTMAELSAELEGIITRQRWAPSPQRLGAIAADAGQAGPKSPSGFDAATDTDLSVEAAERAAAVTAPHLGRVPLPVTEPDRGPPERRRLAPVVAAVLAVLALTALGVIALLR